ncbi:MAG: hypothetical protein WC869_01110 [Phycisphaerae bacterium]|jgi:hypothetical protein
MPDEVKTWYGYTIWTSTKVTINMVSNCVITARAKLTTELTDKAHIVEEVMCGTVNGKDVDDAMEHLVDGAWCDDGLAVPTAALIGAMKTPLDVIYRRSESRFP